LKRDAILYTEEGTVGGDVLAEQTAGRAAEFAEPRPGIATKFSTPIRVVAEESSESPRQQDVLAFEKRSRSGRGRWSD
jgi:hypothetical protein